MRLEFDRFSGLGIDTYRPSASADTLPPGRLIDIGFGKKFGNVRTLNAIPVNYKNKKQKRLVDRKILFILYIYLYLNVHTYILKLYMYIKIYS